MSDETLKFTDGLGRELEVRANGNGFILYAEDPTRLYSPQEVKLFIDLTLNDAMRLRNHLTAAIDKAMQAKEQA